MPLIAILSALAVLTVWGAIAPRGQWRVLAGWTRRNAYASEPGPLSVGVHRVVAILATVALAFGGYTLWRQYEKALPQAAQPLSALQQMWGAPAPLLVNRVIDSASAVPTGLVAQPVLRYQLVDNSRRSPNYLFGLTPWVPKGALAVGGLVGAAPGPGLSALDTAAIVVQVRGDKNCIPRAVYATEDSATVLLAVYYGRPDTAPGKPPATIADCKPVTSKAQSISVLLPVRLQESVGKRVVHNLDGTAIPAAPSLLK